jgi:transglutaminase-like putative cysteine protease
MAMLEPFLRSTRVVDWQDPRVFAQAKRLERGREGKLEVARACFEWVRDEILHTGDHELDPVTCSASDVLTRQTGYCYAKSHLLAALLRANGIACGFAYQRLACDEPGERFCLHGLNALLLPEGRWHRVDARGGRPGLPVGELRPPREHLVFGATAPGETLFAGIWADPVPLVVRALETHSTRRAFLAHLPDAAVLDGADVFVTPRADCE